METRFLITILFSVCMIGQAEAQTDSVGYYSLYLEKGSSSKWVYPGDKIRVTTFKQNEFSHWFRVKSISQQEILFDNGENVQLENLSAVIKKNKSATSVVGAVLLGIGITSLAYLPEVNLDQMGQLLVVGISMTTIGIAIVTPPVFSKKKKSKIQIEKVYRH